MNKFFSFFLLLLVLTGITYSQTLPPVFGKEYAGKAFNDSRVRTYITPQRIVWKYDGGGKLIRNAEGLLAAGNNGQSDLSNSNTCSLHSTENEFASIVLDFGKEIQGGIQFVTASGGKIRVRFGESVSEAMSTVGQNGATNDHAMRDFTMTLPWLGVAETGNSGFRFVRIDLLEPNTEIRLKEVNAVFTYRDIPYLGSFRCNDERLNRIWMTGAYTVHLNMQEYIWDGIKRDRLVWLGDLHPEVMTVSTVFGYNEVIPKSLDLARDITPLPGWMNGMFSYSLWWVIIHRDWYRYQGNLDYLKQQQSYLNDLLRILFKEVDASGKRVHEGGFLDWPASPNGQGINAGMQALMVMAFQAGSELCTVLGDKSLARQCAETAALMQKQVPFHNQLKQAAALLALADMMPADKANNEVIAVGGAKNFSTFYGYYMLQAQAKAGDYQTAMDIISRYWGGMLDLGATSFWEDFNLDWTENAAGIDELVPEGKKDIHGDFGDYCYQKLRHSLCHGWASGPTSWLSQHVLGVQVVEPGCKAIRVEPHLGNLQWVEGTFPTPHGIVQISHKKDAAGKVVSQVKAPKGVKIVK
ncbi:MAG: alpha-L-rhamnosidase [Bacteroidales bacterium]|jgi:hypothetical protein|nr:alpha-L-rhamnosidase [Bacteroidales bacterium]